MEISREANDLGTNVLGILVGEAFLMHVSYTRLRKWWVGGWTLVTWCYQGEKASIVTMLWDESPMSCICYVTEGTSTLN